MATSLSAARVGDPFGHSSAMSGVLTGLAIGALVGVAIVATGGLGAIAIGAAIATTGAAGLAGQAIGQTIDGPVTGVLQTGSPNVFADARPATMTVVATGLCSQDSGPPRRVATGAATVFVNGQPMGRVSEKMDCSAVIRAGSGTVFVGGPSKEVIKPTPEVPTWLSATMTAMVIGGTIIATGSIAATYGVGAAIGSLVGGLGGSYLGGKGATMAAAAMGYGATGQAVAGVIGGFAGGAIGGGVGFKGGQWGESMLPTAGAPAEIPPAAIPNASEASVAPLTPGTPETAPVNQTVYRVDGRPPETIFDEGFAPRGTSTDLQEYVDTNSPSTFVGTSKSPAIADNPAFGQPGKHLYEIDGEGLQGIDVNKAYPDNPFAHEDEIAVPGGIPRESIISARPLLNDGGLGEAVPNPYYKGAP